MNLFFSRLVGLCLAASALFTSVAKGGEPSCAGWVNPPVSSLPDGKYIHCIIDSNGRCYYDVPSKVPLTPAEIAAGRGRTAHDLLLGRIHGLGPNDAVAREALLGQGKFRGGGFIKKDGKIFVHAANSFQSGGLNAVYNNRRFGTCLESMLTNPADQLDMLQGIANATDMPLNDGTQNWREIGFEENELRPGSMEERRKRYGTPAFTRLVEWVVPGGRKIPLMVREGLTFAGDNRVTRFAASPKGVAAALPVVTNSWVQRQMGKVPGMQTAGFVLSPLDPFAWMQMSPSWGVDTDGFSGSLNYDPYAHHSHPTTVPDHIYKFMGKDLAVAPEPVLQPSKVRAHQNLLYFNSTTSDRRNLPGRLGQDAWDQYNRMNGIRKEPEYYDLSKFLKP